MDGLFASRGRLSQAGEMKRFRGRATDKPFGEGAERMTRVSGEGVLLFRTGGRPFTALDVSGDAGYFREEVVFGFEEPVVFENGRVPSQLADLNLVHLRRSGRFLISTETPPVAVDVAPDAPLRMPLAALVGWVDNLTPRVVPLVEGDEAGPAAVELTGDGRVLADPAAALPGLGVQVVFSLERTLSQHVYRAGDGCHREWPERRAALSTPTAALLRRLTPFHQAMLWLAGRLFGDPGLRCVIANSRQVKAEVMRHYRVAPDRITVIHNGLDRSRFKPLPEAARRQVLEDLGAPQGARVVLFAGSGFARKGLVYLIKAFADLKEKNIQLWVVGKGRVGPYQALAKRLNAADRVTFWGPQAEVAPFYQALRYRIRSRTLDNSLSA